jgi:hypothetical protein
MISAEVVQILGLSSLILLENSLDPRLYKTVFSLNGNHAYGEQVYNIYTTRNKRITR